MSAETETREVLIVTRRQLDLARLHVSAAKALNQQPDAFLLAVSQAGPAVTMPLEADLPAPNIEGGSAATRSPSSGRSANAGPSKGGSYAVPDPSGKTGRRFGRAVRRPST